MWKIRIQYISDLHLEFSENRIWLKENMIIPSGDILLIAGDVIPDKYKKHARFFYEEISGKFKHIVSIMGNHEFYSGLVEYSFPKYKSKIGENHYKINNESIIIEDIKIIGSTLWTKIPIEYSEVIYKYMRDYREIYNERYSIRENITIKDTNAFNERSLRYIEEELSKPFEGKIILLTHHLPLFNLSLQEAKNMKELNFAYANDLNEILRKYRVDYWIFGHIHESIDKIIKDTRFLCNPLGYYEEKQYEFFKRDSYFET